MKYGYCLVSLLLLLAACTSGEEALPNPEFRYTIVDNDSEFDERATALLHPDGSLSIQSSEALPRVLLYVPETAVQEYELNRTTYARAVLRDPRLSLGEGKTDGLAERQGFVRIERYDTDRRLVSGTFSFIARSAIGGAPLILKEGRFENLRVTDTDAYYSGGSARLILGNEEQRTLDVRLDVKPAYLDIRITLLNGDAMFLHLPATLGAGEHTLQRNFLLLSAPYFEYRPLNGNPLYAVDSLSTFRVEEWAPEAGRIQLSFTGATAAANDPTDTRAVELAPLQLNW